MYLGDIRKKLSNLIKSHFISLYLVPLPPYEKAFRILKPIRFDWLQLMQGSRAQVDVLNQVLIQSAIKSDNRIAAKHLLKERIANCGLKSADTDEEGTELLNQRLDAKIQSMM